MNYLDMLNMLDLGGVPLYCSERGDDSPIVIAGGPAAFNPDPLADFIDAFVIGEAEGAILEIVKAIKGTDRARSAALKELARIEGVYVPGYNSAVKKRIVQDFNNSYFPT